MFATGFLVGSILGTATCLVLALLHRLAIELEGAPSFAQPALVPLHVSGVSQASLN